MKKYFLTLLLGLLSVLSLLAQESIMQDANDPILQKYISLAMSHSPLKAAADATLEKAKAEKAIATMGLFDMFSGGYFYSPTKNTGLVPVPNGAAGTTSLVMQGFQVGVSVSLGNLLAKPATIKAANADYKMTKAQHDDYKNVLTNNVKSAYYDFLSAKKQLELSNLAARDMKSILQNAQLQFQNGNATIDAYTTAKSASVAADVSLLSAEVTFLKAKNALENLIGKKIEEVK